VNLALLKAELLYAAHRKHGLRLPERILSRPDILGRIGCAMPRLANAALEYAPVRILMEKTIGLSAKRTLSKYTSERFDRWFSNRSVAAASSGRNSSVLLWDDTFVRYNEPHIGKAAVKVLEALGLEVSLVGGRNCCGRPAFSQGILDAAAKLGAHNIELLNRNGDERPILFLEPSCYSMFADDYRELKIANAEPIAKRSFLFEKFVNDLLDCEPQRACFDHRTESVAIHAHCHAKSLLKPGFMAQLVERLPGRRAKMLDTGCCGMAGAFGMMESKRQLSLQVAAPMLEKIRAEGPSVTVIASGTSCRHQISELSSCYPKHMAELLADSLA
jgi:Fe-S oxidoreductase